MSVLRPITQAELEQDYACEELVCFNNYGSYEVGKTTGNGYTVEAIFAHHESSCAWVIYSKNDKLYHCAIKYCERGEV